jgi:hypothetical protein
MLDPPWGALGVFIGVFCKTAVAVTFYLFGSQQAARRGGRGSIYVISHAPVSAWHCVRPTQIWPHHSGHDSSLEFESTF